MRVLPLVCVTRFSCVCLELRERWHFVSGMSIHGGKQPSFDLPWDPILLNLKEIREWPFKAEQTQDSAAKMASAASVYHIHSRLN